MQNLCKSCNLGVTTGPWHSWHSLLQSLLHLQGSLMFACDQAACLASGIWECRPLDNSTGNRQREATGGPVPAGRQSAGPAPGSN